MFTSSLVSFQRGSQSLTGKETQGGVTGTFVAFLFNLLFACPYKTTANEATASVFL